MGAAFSRHPITAQPYEGNCKRESSGLHGCFGTTNEIPIHGWCETPENPDFLMNDKMVILVKIQNFFRSRMTKRTSPLESSREI